MCNACIKKKYKNSFMNEQSIVEDTFTGRILITGFNIYIEDA